MKKTVSHGQEGWLLENGTVRLFLTELGGHAAPVSFYPESKRPIEPYYISPWQEESTLDPQPPVLKPLRGNFFCAPFGADNAYKGENHTPHGEPATARWGSPTVTIEGDRAYLKSVMQTAERPGTITKEISLLDGHGCIYQRHTLEGFSGPMPLGHHATLAAPAKGGLKIGHSPIQFGCTSPRKELATADEEYYALAPLARFSKLERVPTVWKAEPYGDCSIFPAREGFVDIIQIYQKPLAGRKTPAWTTASAGEEGYLWYSLKDPALLNSTVLWMENRGRHGSPWFGRNCCIGLEDVTAYFAEGLKASAKRNPINEAGIATAVRLTPKKPLTIPYIEGAIAVPRGFGRVRKAVFKPGEVLFTDEAGREAAATVAWEFALGGELR